MSAKVLSPLGREYNISIAQVKAMCPMIVGGGGVSVSPTPTAATSSILFLWLHFFKKKRENSIVLLVGAKLSVKYVRGSRDSNWL